MVSESDISVKGHGVHTAYVELTHALQKRSDCTVIVNDFTHQTSADVMHLHSLGLHAWRKLLFGKAKVKVISAHVVPASFVGSIMLARFWLPLAKLYLGWAYRRADVVLAVSKMVAESLQKELRVPSQKITVFYNSIDTTQYTPSAKKRASARKKLGITHSEFVVIGNGQVQPRKRLDTFIAMAHARPNFRFIWIGGIPFKFIGADYQNMQKMMKNIPNNMIITGVIDLKDVKTYLAVADAFVLPAEQENHPMAVIEAAAAGLPIILRDIPEYDDTFGNDTLLAAKDAEFVAQLDRLYSDRQFRKEWHNKSMKIAKRFDSTLAAEKLMKIYKEAISA